MSSEAMEAVLANSKSVGGPRGVLLALAWKTFDTKPPFGGPFTPAYIARLANVSERQAIRSIGRLMALGELAVGGKRGRAYTYVITLPLAKNYDASVILDDANYDASVILDDANYDASVIPNYDASVIPNYDISGNGSYKENNINSNKQKASPDKLSNTIWRQLTQRIEQRESLGRTLAARLRNARLELYSERGLALVVTRASPDNYARDFLDFILLHLRPVTGRGWQVDVLSEQEIAKAERQEPSSYAEIQ